MRKGKCDQNGIWLQTNLWKLKPKRQIDVTFYKSNVDINI